MHHLLWVWKGEEVAAYTFPTGQTRRLKVTWLCLRLISIKTESGGVKTDRGGNGGRSDTLYELKKKKNKHSTQALI